MDVAQYRQGAVLVHPRGWASRHPGFLKFITGTHDFLLEFGGTYDAHQLHIGSRLCTVARRFHLENPQVKPLEQGVIDEGQILDVLQWDGLLGFEIMPLGEPQMTGCQRTLQAVVVKTRHPLTPAQQPNQQHGNAHHRHQQ